MGDAGPVREDHWWERVFNEASSNVNINKSEAGVTTVDLNDKNGVEITNKSFSLKKLKESNTTLQYGSFLKSATLLANIGTEEEIKGHVTTNDIEIKPIQVLSDADLFKACGGRTAHKGARHGLNLTGKLQRIAQQEKDLLERMKGKQNKHEVFREPLAKKCKKNPLVELNSSKDDTSDDNRLPVDTDTDYILKPSKRRKKRDKKEELQLVDKISGIGLDESQLNSEILTEQDEEEEKPYNGTPVRKKKKSKQATEKLFSIEEIEPSSDEIPQKTKKKKKGKRKLDEDDDEMVECKEKYSKQKQNKPKKVKLDESYEASGDEEDIVKKINKEQEERHLLKAKKKSRKAIKKEKNRAKATADFLAQAL